MSAAAPINPLAADALSSVTSDIAVTDTSVAAPMAVPVPPPPSQATLEAFRNALAGATPPASVTPTSVTGATANARNVASAASAGAGSADTGLASTPIGARIIDKLQGMSNTMDHNFRIADQALSGAGTVHDIMRVQMSLVSWSYQTELVTKAVAKASQDVDQLLKMQ
ncbi:type III secretion system inner rod subunit SctI [Paraburkholderia hayleyella]|uniref:type III secretion system inner rod subunit SctI n=1 Tax=Paraburkholderia hayleyella TaxID=2152889 RepID=UPI00129131CD|nr:type III secretion system inner rod subunit SctI [Paraburkholderia hayleyella]